jgi:hypothetical protein
MKILLGEEAKSYLKELEIQNWNNKNADILGGMFQSEIPKVYIAYDCRGSEIFVEDFDDIVEAAKYANGIQARTINNEYL